MERLTPERRRDLTRTALLDAAERVFAERGYHAASLDEIAEAAGFTRGAVYSNFSGKDGLLVGVLERHSDRSFQAFTEAVDASAGPAGAATSWSTITEQWSATIGAAGSTLPLLLEFRLLALRDPEVQRRFAAYETRIEESLAAFLVAAEARGAKFPLPAADLAVVLYAAAQGLHQRAALHGGGLAPLLDDLLAVALGR